LKLRRAPNRQNTPHHFESHPKRQDLVDVEFFPVI
jgi:hypothetical protein